MKPQDENRTQDSGHGNPPPKDKNDQTRAPAPIEEAAVNSVDSGHGEPPPKGDGK